MYMEFVNLTPHDINFVREGQENIVIPPSGEVARVETKEVYLSTTQEGIDLIGLTYGKVTGFPQRQDGCFYIVSAMVAAALRDAYPDANLSDVGSPSRLVRDASGKIIGCSALVIP
jgi:hypothetical protein